MGYLLLGLQGTLAALLTIAAFSKLAYPQQILMALRRSIISAWLAPYVAGLVILFEIEIALALLFSVAWLLSLAFLCAFVLLGLFTIWILRVLHQNLQISCGCFGPSHARINKRYLVRNSCLMSITLGGFILSFFTTSALPGSSEWSRIIAVLCIPIIVCLLWLRLSQADQQLETAV